VFVDSFLVAKMNKSEHGNILKSFLMKRYSLDIEVLVSLDELLVAEYSFDENMDLVKRYLRTILSERRHVIVDRITLHALETLHNDLLETDKTWIELIKEEMDIKDYIKAK
jgi:hypothetical protein